MNRRVTTAEQRVEIARLYLAGTPVTVIAADLGIAPRTVYSALYAEGVDTARKPAFTAEQVRELVAGYAALWTIRELAHAHRCSFTAVRRALLDAGVQLRDRGWWGKP